MVAFRRGLGSAGTPVTDDDLMVLAEDARVIAVGDLPRTIRMRIGDPDGGYVVSRRSSRSPSLLVEHRAAQLVAAFREPRTIVSGVLAYSRAMRLDPRAVLEGAYPLLERLIRRGFLVPAEAAGTTTPRLTPGDAVDDFVVDRPVQVLEDTEVHLAHNTAGDAVALKLARPQTPPEVDAMLHREAQLLRRLDGGPTPKLVATGSVDGCPYLASAWCPGMDVVEAAAVARVGGDAELRLRALGREVIGAYARLHRLGVLHGDVHPRNVLVNADGHVTLLDFGLARPVDPDPGYELPPRRGVGFWFEPEFARAHRRGLGPVAATPGGEQYAVAALVYLLLTGVPHADFRLDDELWRQIEEALPLPFADRGVPPWSAGEAVLARALSKAAADRFPSVSAFAQSFRAACGGRAPAASGTGGPSAATVVLDAALRRLDADPAGVALAEPTCSAHSGAAGIAIAFHRLACIREDAALLARADAWAQWAVERAGSAGAFPQFAPPGRGDGPGPASIHHATPGPLYARALISLAQGDAVAARSAVRAFCAAITKPAVAVDVTFGAAGALLACANLLGALRGAEETHRRVVEAGEGLHASIADTRSLPWLGAAHGWAGLLYASLCWTQAVGRRPGPGVVAHLDRLRGQATQTGPRAWWPRRPGPVDPQRSAATGWCHGSAGHVHLWCAASAAFPRGTHFELAKRSALHAAGGDPARPGGSLCCGYAGQAYACLAVLRRTGDAVWHRRARALADRAAVWALRGAPPDSLYAGALGVALLAADLKDPANARMPLFEPDGWPAV